MRAFFCKKGNHMTDHEELYRKALAFTGSTETAEEIALSAADQPDHQRDNDHGLLLYNINNGGIQAGHTAV